MTQYRSTSCVKGGALQTEEVRAKAGNTMSLEQRLVGHETEFRCYSRRSRGQWRLSNRITWWRMDEREHH